MDRLSPKPDRPTNDREKLKTIQYMPQTEAARRFMSVEELVGDPQMAALRDLEFGGAPQPGDGSELERRDFLKVVSTTFAAASLTAACGRLPERLTIPYAQKPEEVTPGKALYYATVCRACPAGCSVLMKSRDGRPIKVEGNPEHPVSHGGVCAIGQASVLNLYDGDRCKKPQLAGKDSDWKTVDAEVTKALTAYKTDGSKLALLSRRVSGPGSTALLQQFLAQFSGARHVLFEPAELSASVQAHGLTHSKATLPSVLLDQAQVVVSLGADFLGTWGNPVAQTKQWSRTRKVSKDKKTMSRLLVAETRMSVTGSNADERLRVLPSEERAIALGLAQRIAKSTGFSGTFEAPASDKAKVLDAWAQQLLAAPEKAIVLSGSADVAVQAAVNLMNQQLGAYGKTLSLDSSVQRGGDEAALDKLLDDLNSGAVTGIIVCDVNPAYAHRKGAQWAQAIAKAPVSIALSQRPDETAQKCKILAAVHHPLESWGDDETVLGTVSMQQPLVQPIFDTRGLGDSLLAWTAGQSINLRDALTRTWQLTVYPRARNKAGDFQTFWDKAVHDGFVQVGREQAQLGAAAGGPAQEAAPQPAAAAGEAPASALAAAVTAAALPAEASAVALPVAATPAAPEVKLVAAPPAQFSAAGVQKALATPAFVAVGSGAYEVVAYAKVGVGDGEHANNPFLQELPDPISKVTWGSYVCLSPATAAKLGVASQDVVKVSVAGTTVQGPVVLSPGLHDSAVGLPLGYGRTAAGRVGNGLGANAWPIAHLGVAKGEISKTGERETVAFSQTHHSAEHRDHVREASLHEWQANGDAGNEPMAALLRDKKAGPLTTKGSSTVRETRSMWDRHKYPGYRWGMVIDLNSCTGCGACVIACNVENNIPVVGKSEVVIRREMHWMRIDRYFSEKRTFKRGEYDWDPTADDLLALAENPEVVHQPMLCHHCENAPCETVCPVLATVHTTEGLNAQAYNRCIGTRYCANNCPYKVRRFNWFNYPSGDMEGKQDVDLVALALNPDVVKRTRGVMEKCSFCVQRIQEGKAEAVRLNQKPRNQKELDAADAFNHELELAQQQGQRLTEKRQHIQSLQVADGDVLAACQQTCPADAIAFGDLNDDSSAVRKAWEDSRNYGALAEIGVQPVVSFLTKVRNVDRPIAGEPASHGKHPESGHQNEKAEG